MQSKFFQQINYSSSTEDSEAELLALQLSQEDEVVCVTGSGARPLDLLVAQPSSIHSVDFNGAQNHLLRLKVVAFENLDYADFAEFIGLSQNADSDQRRREVYRQLSQNLTKDCQGFWGRNSGKIEKGILYCGTWEKLLRAMSKTTVLRKRHVAGLLEAPSIEAQAEYWKQHWSGWFFKSYLRALSNRFLWTSVIREPGAKLIPKDFDVADYLFQCLTRMSQHSLMRENPYANLLFYGRYSNECVLPPHLQERNFDLVKSQLDKIRIVDEDLAAFLADSQDRFDAFSLSDFSSYAALQDYRSVWSHVQSSAKQNAKFCERQFLVKRDLNEKYLRRDKRLEENLQQLDHTCLYTFCAGRVIRA